MARPRQRLHARSWMLLDRLTEQAALGQLLEAARGGRSGALEVHGVVFGLRAGEAPDRFLVGLAALSLLADAAGKQPLLCVIDDAQWLDRASAQAMGFVARRLLAEQAALVVATR